VRGRSESIASARPSARRGREGPHDRERPTTKTASSWLPRITGHSSTLQRLELGDDDGGEASEFCVVGDELGVVCAGCGVEKGVGHGEAVVEADVGGGESGHLVESDDAAVESLREEAIGEGLAAVAGELTIDLVDDERGDDDGSLVLQVVSEQRGL
jgi:hypothetical protein